MRGLTATERQALTCPQGEAPGLLLRDILELQKRGLIAVDHLGDRAEYDVLPMASLALRLDAAARAASP
jgi:hypothetical protein